MIKNYRKRPVIIQALQFTGENFKEVTEFCPTATGSTCKVDQIVIPTLEGNMLAFPGDYIVKGIKGEFYPCKPDIFEQTNEDADEKRDFSSVIKPVMQWLKENHHPHTSIILDSCYANLVEGIEGVPLTPPQN